MGLVFLWAIFQQVPAIRGWTVPELLLMYGLMVLAQGITQAFFDGFWTIGSGVYDGRFDTFLSRPMPALLAVLTFWMSPEGIGGVLLGLVLCVTALTHMSLSPQPIKVLVSAIVVTSGLSIRPGITLMLNCISFWSSGPLSVGDFNEPLYELGRYPLELYSPVIRVVMTTVMPIAFVSIIPTTYLTNGDAASWPALLGPLVALLVWGIALRIFRQGIRNYSSTGA